MGKIKKLTERINGIISADVEYDVILSDDTESAIVRFRMNDKFDDMITEYLDSFHDLSAVNTAGIGVKIWFQPNTGE